MVGDRLGLYPQWSHLTPEHPFGFFLHHVCLFFSGDNLSSDALRLATGSEAQFHLSGQPLKACSKMKKSFLKSSKPQSERS